jgi:hypothetical protein
MNWHYALGGQQQGPIDDAQLDALIAAGTITSETLVWREGMPAWQPLRQARPAAPAPFPAPPITAAPPGVGPAPAANEVRCCECGNSFTRDNVIQYGNSFVCAGCKPVFVQKLREGATPGGAPSSAGGYVDPDTLVAEAIARGPSVDIGSCLSRAWDLLKQSFWLVVGATFVNQLCQGVASGIPIVGYCSGPILQGPLMGGLYWFYLRLYRKEDAQFGDVFSGFSNFLQLMLASIVITALVYVCFAPAGILFVIGSQANNDSMLLAGGIAALATLPVAAYLFTCWMFTYLLMVDRKYTFWTAMNVSRRVINKCWWGMFGLFIVVLLLQIVGVLALCVGVFVTLTFLYSTTVVAYEDIFSGRRDSY